MIYLILCSTVVIFLVKWLPDWSKEDMLQSSGVIVSKCLINVGIFKNRPVKFMAFKPREHNWRNGIPPLSGSELH